MIHTSYIAFTLGREWRLSLAELIALYGISSMVVYDERVAIFHIEDCTRQDFLTLGGTIRAIEVREISGKDRFLEATVEDMKERHSTVSGGKIHFALGAYASHTIPLFELGLRVKKYLATSGITARLINKDNSNIVSAVWKGERLDRSRMEYNFLEVSGKSYLGITLFCQDIDAYTRRDTEKIRDMDVGMLPPKLAQIMIHLACEGESISSLYDPFVGLGTIPIEALNMGMLRVMGSDRVQKMVDATHTNIIAFQEEEEKWASRIRARGHTPHKNMSEVEVHIFPLDATRIGSDLPKNISLTDTVIVSEGYLGEIMKKESITLESVRAEREKLVHLYRAFFAGLAKLHFMGTIVLTFPFWNIRGTHSYFTEREAILEEYHIKTLPLLPPPLDALLTPRKTLLYRRPSQQVGREVWRGRILS